MSLTPAPGLVYRTTGGELDIYFFLGPRPEQVVSQYVYPDMCTPSRSSPSTQKPLAATMFPHTGLLGFTSVDGDTTGREGPCRSSLSSLLISLTNMEAAWQRTRDAGIPFDAQWGDIDIMDRALDFTVNPNEFSGLSEFAHNLHEVEHF